MADLWRRQTLSTLDFPVGNTENVSWDQELRRLNIRVQELIDLGKGRPDLSVAILEEVAQVQKRIRELTPANDDQAQQAA